MTDWIATDFRKLFINPPPDFERLPFVARAIGAELVRRCDRQGHIVPVTHTSAVTVVTSQPSLLSQLVADVSFHVRAHPGEESAIGQALTWLLENRYLVFKDGYLTIRNYPQAQRSSSAERMARKRAVDGVRRNGKSSDGDVTVVTPVTGDESDQEEKRREEKRRDPPKPPEGDPPKPSEIPPHESIRALAVRAYGEGVSTVTGVAGFGMSEAEEQVIMSAIDVTPKWVGLRGSMLADRIRNSAAAYANENRDRAGFEKGFSPTKWVEWLRAGGAPTSRTRVRTAEHVDRKAQAAHLRAVGDHDLADKIERGDE